MRKMILESINSANDNEAVLQGTRNFFSLGQSNSLNLKDLSKRGAECLLQRI